ncbi:MAG: hypothetical protein ACJAY7_000318 [Pseudohongiellaceae bacterium]|jgi:hypothetical protein
MKTKKTLNAPVRQATQILFSATMLITAGISQAQSTAENEWIQLFNGDNLDNWQIKFTGFELGENYRDTFKVIDGLLTVSYDNWPDFNNEFGHMFYDQSFSHYELRIEYRFIGEQVTNGPSWAYRNNGMMLHSQAPESMTIDQEFPASIEAQMLGGNGIDPRPTGNVCTPGTHMVMNGELITRHCTNSNSKTFHGNQWVTMKMIVRGSESISQIVNGITVMEYQDIQLDNTDPDAQTLIQNGATIELDEGYISIQAESHPIQFRKIELRVLDYND